MLASNSDNLIGVAAGFDMAFSNAMISYNLTVQAGVPENHRFTTLQILTSNTNYAKKHLHTFTLVPTFCCFTIF